MVIVQGVFRLDPAERERYLAESVENMRVSRAEPGCLEYVVAADPAEPDRVILSERWASIDDLNEHTRALNRRRKEAADAGAAPGVTLTARDIWMYELDPAAEQKMV